jgi:hypothetical protein
MRVLSAASRRRVGIVWLGTEQRPRPLEFFFLGLSRRARRSRPTVDRVDARDYDLG